MRKSAIPSLLAMSSWNTNHDTAAERQHSVSAKGNLLAKTNYRMLDARR